MVLRTDTRHHLRPCLRVNTFPDAAWLPRACLGSFIQHLAVSGAIAIHRQSFAAQLIGLQKGRMDVGFSRFMSKINGLTDSIITKCLKSCLHSDMILHLNFPRGHKNTLESSLLLEGYQPPIFFPANLRSRNHADGQFFQTSRSAPKMYCPPA